MFYNDANNGMIQTLCPAAQVKAREWLAECEKAGCWLKVTSGYRSWASQAWLYAQGRYRPGPIVTNAKPGTSMHGYRIALDYCPADGRGVLHWDDMARIRQMADIAKGMGATYGGDWPSFQDNYHLEWLFGKTEAYFMKGGKI